MAQAIRVGPGQYTVNGKRYNARDSQTALRMAGAASGGSSTTANPTTGHAPGNLRGQERRDFYNAQGSTNGQSSGLPGAAPVQQNATTAEVAQGGNNVADQSFDLAMQSIQDPNNQVGQAFNPTLTKRLSDGDLLANRQKVEDAVYGRLTKDNQKNKAFDSNALEQNLYNRGIPFDPNDPQRGRWTGALDKRYDDLDASARQSAISQADAANAQEISMNEGMITNDYNIAQGINQTQMGNYTQLGQNGSQIGSGVVNNAATNAAMNALKKKTPAEIALMNAQAGAANRPQVGNGASSNQSAFG